MSQSLVKRAGLIAVSCLLGCLAYPGYGQEAPLGPAQSLLQEALEHVYNSEYELAEQACEEVIASYPEHEYDARLMLAEVYWAQGRLTEAIEQAKQALDKVTRLYPDDSQRIAEAQAGVNRLREAQENFTVRIAEYQQIIQQQPGSAAALDAQYRLGGVYAICFKYDQAIAQFTNLIKEHPKSAEAIKAFSALQGVLAQAERSQEALTVLPELVRTHWPGSAQMLLKLCQFYRNQGKLGQAIPLAETIAASFPQSIQVPKALLIATRGYRQVGKLADAQAAAEKLVADYSNSTDVMEALEHLIAIYDVREGPEAAGAKLRALAVEHPDTKVATATGEVIGQAAASCYKKGLSLGGEDKYAQAIVQFDKVLALRPPGEIGAWAAYENANCHHALGQIQRTATMLRETIQQSSPEDWIAEMAEQELIKLAQDHPEIGEVELLPPKFKRIEPNRLSVKMRAGEQITREVTLTGNPAFRVTAAHCELSWVNAALGERKLGEPGLWGSRYEVQLSLGPNSGPGQYESALMIETNDTQNARIQVPLTVDVLSPE